MDFGFKFENIAINLYEKNRECLHKFEIVLIFKQKKKKHLL